MIGVFDSGFGGLTILGKFIETLPEYDYIFLGDNARAPYGNRSYETVYSYTLQAVRKLFALGCPIVILACNTASAKALRSIQQNNLKHLNPDNRVLGIIRPTAEIISSYTKTNKVGILGTAGTVNSKSYILEINKLHPEIEVYQQACPLLAALVESGEVDCPGTDYFVKKYYDQLMAQCPDIDTIILGCTHYPLLMKAFQRIAGKGVTLVPQNGIVADSLKDYLARHPEMDARLTKNGTVRYLTTDNSAMFDQTAALFLNREIHSERLVINE